jgi:signal transduction histidine kinase
MVGMEERVVLIGGKLCVSADERHGGTVITDTVPVK